ncbi:hypothetical protein JCM8097_006703 [Rhodosporidiobolus ruineniae]
MHSRAFAPRLVLLPTLLLLAALVGAAPTAPNLVYPLQAQLPPVARLNQAFTWSLLPGTFNASSDSIVTLSTRSLPSWCTFDATTDTFSGLPGSSDLGSTPVTVTANTTGVATGASDSFTLLVVDPNSEPQPYVRLSIENQLASAAAVSGGGTLTPDGALKVPPQWSFSFGFQQYTFQTALRQKIFYAAIEDGTTSLPSWIEFDNSTVTFDGLAPSVDGEYKINVYGSERYGYGDVVQTLRIVVAQHSFELLGVAAAEAEKNGSTVLRPVQVTPGGAVNYSIPLDDFRIDNSSISVANLTSVTADFSALSNLSSALQLNFPALTLIGEIPFDFEPSTYPLPLTFVDQYNSTVHTNLSIVVEPSLFDTSLFPQTVNVQLGKPFQQALSPFFASTTPSRKRAASTPDATFAATITPAEAEQWISFDPSALSLSGTAPSTVPSYGNATVEILATPASGIQSRAELIFAVVSSGTNTTTTHPHHPGSSSGLSQSAKLGLGLGLGLGGGLILLALLAFCCYKKRKNEGEDDRQMRRSTSQQLSASAYSPNPMTDASTITVVDSRAGAYTPGAGAKLGAVGEEKVSAVPLAPPVPGADGMALPLHQRGATPAKEGGAGARRFDVMGMLFRSESGWSARSAFSRKKGKAKAGSISLGGGAGGAGAAGGKTRKEDVSYPRPALPQESSLFGLGIDDEDDHTGPHQVVIVAGEDGLDGRRATTYRENSDPNPVRAQTPSSSGNGSRRGGPGRVSSWESGGSSSLFYSDRSDARSAASPAPDSPFSRAGSNSPASSGRSRRAPSIPMRRRDFLPLPLKSPTASENGSPVPSPTRETYDAPGPGFYRHGPAETSLERDESGGSSGSAPGIRIVGSHSDSSSSHPYSSHPSDLDAAQSSTPNQHHALPHVTSFQQYSSPSRSGSYPSDPPSSSDSLGSPAAPAPRLIPFAAERRPEPFTRTMTSQSSLRARGLDPEQVEDAEEDEAETSFGNEAEGEYISQQEDGEGEWEYEEGPSGVSAVSSARRRGGIRPGSGVYHGEGEPEESVVYYGPDDSHASASFAQPRETWRSPSGFADSVYSYQDEDGEQGDDGGMRYVGSVASTSAGPSPYLPSSGSPAVGSTNRNSVDDRASGSYYAPSDVFSHHSTATTAPTPTSAGFRHSQTGTRPSFDRPYPPPLHKRASSYHDPIRVPLEVDVPFRFTPRLASPPFVAITSSPGRGGPPRATYHAFCEVPPAGVGDEEVEDEDEGVLVELPGWLNFDGGAMEMFGKPGAEDGGAWRVVVVERKVMRTPGSPTRSGRSASPERGRKEEDVTEMVVGRLELIVGGGEEGEMRVVSY